MRLLGVLERIEWTLVLERRSCRGRPATPSLHAWHWHQHGLMEGPDGEEPAAAGPAEAKA